MARKPTMQEGLIALGIEKLATLIMDEAGRSAAFKKIVAAALAGAKGPAAVAAIVDRRLASLSRAKGLIDWNKRKAFADDLKATVATITGELGSADPAAAVERLVTFLAIAGSVLGRVDDSTGSVQAVFEDAAEAISSLAPRLESKAKLGLIRQLIAAIQGEDHGFAETAFLGIARSIQPSDLKSAAAALDTALAQAKPGRSEDRDWDKMARHDRLRRARQAVADQAGDVDTFMALERGRPEGLQNREGVATLLLKAGRLSEALEWVRRPKRSGIRVLHREDMADGSRGFDFTDRKRIGLEVSILAAQGDLASAQALRWDTFARLLDADMLRAFVASLPDFEEFDALDRAFALVAGHAHRYGALAFFIEWKRLDLAAKLVLDHPKIWEGRNYEVLSDAAATLEHDHPRAATILYRALIDDILARSRSQAYGHGARYFRKIALMDIGTTAGNGLESHATYHEGLKKTHGRKYGFWTLLDGAKPS